MKLFPSCFSAPQSKQLLILTAIWTLAMVMATFIAIGASADDTSPDGLATLILTVGMFAVRYMATQRGWKYGRGPTDTAGQTSFPKTLPVMALMAIYAIGGGYVSWLVFSWFNDNVNPGSSVLGLMALTLVVASFTWLGVRVAAMRGYRLATQPKAASAPTS
jgi:hypothetical protein